MKLSDLIKEIEVKIPNTDLVITIYSDWSWYDEIKANKIKDIDERGKYLMMKIIKSWNLLGEDEKALPITDEVIERLPKNIVNPLLSEISNILDKKNEKKKS